MLIKEGWKPDIVHAHVFRASVPAVLLKLRYGFPVVVTEHWTGFMRRRLTFSERMKARFGMNRVDMILPVSRGLEKAIRHYRIHNRFCVVPNAIDTSFFSLNGRENAHKNRKRILFVGHLTEQKGLPVLLWACNLRDGSILSAWSPALTPLPYSLTQTSWANGFSTSCSWCPGWRRPCIRSRGSCAGTSSHSSSWSFLPTFCLRLSLRGSSRWAPSIAGSGVEASARWADCSR